MSKRRCEYDDWACRMDFVEQNTVINVGKIIK